MQKKMVETKLRVNKNWCNYIGKENAVMTVLHSNTELL